MSRPTPKVFISYSHDSEAHKDWVLTLATRLMSNGVNVVLDQWDLELGGDLPLFMESGLTSADRVIAVCTGAYVEKANAGKGGVGYERMIITPSLMRNISDTTIIPVIRNSEDAPTPTFLASKLYIDFRNDSDLEAGYARLIREIHGEGVKPRPALGPNPFDDDVKWREPRLEFSSERYVSPTLRGVVTFDYSDNNGEFVLGSGKMAFETKWSSASNDSIHSYVWNENISTMAIAFGVEKISDIRDAGVFNTSSTSRTPRINEIIVWQNSAGYYAAALIVAVSCRSHGREGDSVTFSYVVQPNRTGDFSNFDEVETV